MIEIQEDAAGIVFTLTLVDEDGDAVNLTSATVTFYVLPPPGISTVVEAHTMTITAPATGGIATYTLAAADIDDSGAWKGQVKVHFSASSSYPSEVFPIRVISNIY